MSLKLSSLDLLDSKSTDYKLHEFNPIAERNDLHAIVKQLELHADKVASLQAFKSKSGKNFLLVIPLGKKIDSAILDEIDNGHLEPLADKELRTLSANYVDDLTPIGLKDVKVIIEKSFATASIIIPSGQWGVWIELDSVKLLEICNAKFMDLIKHANKLSWEELKLDKKFLPRISLASELKPAILLNKISEFKGKNVNLNGWIFNKRSSGKIMFLQFRDGSGDIQAVVEKGAVTEAVWAAAEELTIESSLQITGNVREDSRSASGFELGVTDIKIIQISPEYPIGKKEHGPDFLLDNRHLWLRSSKQRAALKLRDEIFFSITSFLREESFIRVDTPIFQPVSCEDTSELFSVNYFGEKTYLTQSGQLYCEAAEYALGRTYDFGPVFRAEKSKTRKHLIEFWMMDAELPFTDINGLMDFEEKMIKRIVADCLKNCPHELKVLERDIAPLQKVIDKFFIRRTHKQIIDELNEKFKMNLTYLDDVGAPEEEKLSTLYDVPVFISEWPAKIKSFYMPHYMDGDMRRVRSLDMIASEGYGELCGGAEREFDFNKLLEIVKEKNYPYEDYEWYLDLRKYGTIPHSGFGIGLERTVRWIGGIKHIRETIPFPRMLNRLYP